LQKSDFSSNNHECYYPANKGLLAFFSVRQGKWVDLLLDLLWFNVICTLVTLEPLTGIQGYEFY